MILENDHGLTGHAAWVGAGLTLLLLCIGQAAVAQAPGARTVPPLRFLSGADKLTFKQDGGAQTGFRLVPGRPIRIATSGTMTLIVHGRPIAGAAGQLEPGTVLVRLASDTGAVLREAREPLTSAAGGPMVSLSDGSLAGGAKALQLPIDIAAGVVDISIEGGPGAVVTFARAPFAAPAPTPIVAAPTSAPAPPSPGDAPAAVKAPPPDAVRRASPSRRTAANTIFLELAGNGAWYSINYDRVMNDFVSVRAGFSYMSISANAGSGGSSASAKNTWIMVPVMPNFLLGGANHKLEVGAGALFIQYSGSASASSGGLTGEADASGLTVNGTGRLGYRYVPADGGFHFQVAYTPIYVQGYGIIHWGGMGFGYTF